MAGVNGQTGKTLADLLNVESLRKRSTPSNFRLGTEIEGAGGVEIMEPDLIHVIAKVQPASGQRRSVTMSAGIDGLKWKCTCTSDLELFSKHCVAAGLAAGKRITLK